MRSDLGSRKEVRYTWKSAPSLGLAHLYSQYALRMSRCGVEPQSYTDDADFPTKSRAEGKPRCGVCLDLENGVSPDEEIRL